MMVKDWILSPQDQDKEKDIHSHFCQLLLNTVMENVDKAIRQGKSKQTNKQTEVNHIGKKKVKLSLFVDMIMYIENPKGSTKNNIRTNKQY